MSISHDKNCVSRWNASSECDCGVDRENAEKAINILETVNRELEYRVDALEAKIIKASKQRFQDGYMDGRRHACALLSLTVYDLDGAALDQEQLIALCAFAEDALTGENP